MVKKPEEKDTRPLPERLAEWLSSQGYPLEMRVAAALKDAGFNTVLSNHYSDPETNTPREIDVVASKWAAIANVTVQVTIVVECRIVANLESTVDCS